MIPCARPHDDNVSLRRCGTDRSPSEAPPGPRISVVIPTFRRPDLLCRCLAAVYAQTLDRSAYEVVVVDGGHGADAETVVDSFRSRLDGPVLRLLRPHRGRGPAVARNAGWRAAYGSVIAFTEDDAVPDPDWLENGERALAPGLVALCGRVAVQPAPRCVDESPAPGRVGEPPAPGRVGEPPQGAGRKAPPPSRPPAEFVAANAFVRRSALLTVGGFDERFQQACRESSDLQFRLARDAGPIGRSEEAVVLQPARLERWGGCLRRQERVFFDALLYKKHPQLYRERIFAAPPWLHYGIVALTAAAALFWAADIDGSAIVSLLLALAGIGRVALTRLRREAAARPLATVLTSALIPFLSVYWRLRGAIHFRVLFL